MKKTDLYLKPGTYIRSSVTQGDVQGISLENFVVSVLNNPTCCAKPVFIKNGMLMTTNYLSGSLQSVLDQGSNTSPLQLSTQLVRIESNLEVAERLKIESDSTVTTQTSAVIEATTTNSSIVLKPNGTGAIIASVPDGTATGGNARGTGAVDLQMSRSAATQVNSGANSFLGGGINNTLSGSRSVLVGGNTNTVGGVYCFLGGGISNSVGGYSSDYNSIVGGYQNTINAQGNNYSFIGGGFNNTIGANALYSTISGGQSNTASTNTHATVIGGFGNTSSGSKSITGGESNTASNSYSIAFGYSNTVSGGSSAAIGYGNNISGTTCYAIGQWNGATTVSSFAFGIENGANSDYSFALGYKSKTYLNGQLALSRGFFAANGDSQQSLLTARRESSLNSAATTILSLDGTGTTNLIIPNGNNRLWAAKIVATAFVSVAGGTLVLGDSYMGEYTLLFKRVGGTSSVVGINATNTIYDTNMATAAFTFAAGASQDLQITFKAPTTASATTFRCVAKVELVEVAY